MAIKSLFIFNATRCVFKHSSYYIFPVCFCCLVTGCHDGSIGKNINMLNTWLLKSMSTGIGRELLSLVIDVNLYPLLKMYFNLIDIEFNNVTKFYGQCEWFVTPLINSKSTMLEN